MFVCLLAQTAVWASPAGASVVLGGNCLFSLAHLRTCSSAPRQREMLKAMGGQCWESQALSQHFPGEDPLSLWCGFQFRVRTWLCLVLERLRAVPYSSDGTGVTAHPVGQLPALWGLPWVISKHQQIEIARYKCLERLQMLGKCSRAPLGRCFVSPQTLSSIPRQVTRGLGTVEAAARSHHLFPHSRNFLQPSDALADK